MVFWPCRLKGRGHVQTGNGLPALLPILHSAVGLDRSRSVRHSGGGIAFVDDDPAGLDPGIVDFESNNVHGSAGSQVFGSAAFKLGAGIEDDRAVPSGFDVEILLYFKLRRSDFSDATPNVGDVRGKIQNHEPAR